MANGSQSTLSVLFPEQKLSIKGDLSKLKAAGILHSVKLSRYSYCKGFPFSLYVYEHSGHNTFSQTKFSTIASCSSGITEIEDHLDNCKKHDNHDFLLPYFYANTKLKYILRKNHSRKCG